MYYDIQPYVRGDLDPRVTYKYAWMMCMKRFMIINEVKEVYKDHNIWRSGLLY